MRRICLIVPNWSVAALSADVPPGAPAALIERGRVVAANYAASRWGIKPHMRLFDAYEICPDLIPLDPDPTRVARAFTPIVTVASDLMPSVETLRPGTLWAPSSSPARWVGSEDELVRTLLENVASETAVDPSVGVGDGPLAALWAANCGRVISSADTLSVIAAVPLTFLVSWGLVSRSDGVQLVNLLHTLGIDSCGELAQLAESEVYARFGDFGRNLHRLAAGGELFIQRDVRISPDVRVHHDFDPPAGNIDQALFCTKPLSERLCDQLSSKGLQSPQVEITATTQSGEQVSGTWSLLEGVGEDALVRRVRWQLESWLQARHFERGICRLTLRALHPVPFGSQSQSLWGPDPQKLEHAHRAVTRVMEIEGPGSVKRPVWHGGFDPTQSVKISDFTDPEPEPPSVRLAALEPDSSPWQGSVFEAELDWPQQVFDPVEINLLDAAGTPVGIDVRGNLTAQPDRVEAPPKSSQMLGFTQLEVCDLRVWQVWGRWWEPTSDSGPRAYGRIKDQGHDLLLRYQGGGWSVVASFADNL